MTFDEFCSGKLYSDCEQHNLVNDEYPSCERVFAQQQHDAGVRAEVIDEFVAEIKRVYFDDNTVIRCCELVASVLKENKDGC